MTRLERRLAIIRAHGGNAAGFDAMIDERDAYRKRAIAAEQALSKIRQALHTIDREWQEEASSS